MRMTPATLVPALCAALSMAAAGGPPPEYRFEADARSTSVADVALRSGDSADLVWRLRGPDGAPWDARAAEAVYQTNGMPDNLWWPAPASCASNEVRVSWTPALDPGADSVFMLVRVRGCAWRCATRIRIARGPGERPNELPLPVQSIDFGAVAVTNAPWALPSEVDASIAAATNAIPRPEPPDLSPYATTGRVDSAVAAATNAVLILARSVVAAATNALVEAYHSGGGSPYADPAPWEIAAALLPVAEGTAAETNAVGDMAEVLAVSATWQDCRFSIAVEARPAPWDYEAPTGTWSIVSDPAGAASSITPDGLLLSSRLAAGTVTVAFDAGAAGTKTRAVFLQAARAETPLPGLVELPGSPRWAWQTNLLSRLAAACGPDVPRAAYSYAYGGMPLDEPHSLPESLSPWATTGDSGPFAPTASNPAFFWPALASNLLCVSWTRNDLPPSGPWGRSPVLAVSPHWAIQAAHWNYAPNALVFRTWPASSSVVVPSAGRVARGGGSDLALVRYRDPFPEACIARLCPSNELARVSPTLFRGAVGLAVSQHDTVHPFVVGAAAGGGPSDWRVPFDPAATGSVHRVHGGDSGRAYGVVSPSGKFVPFGCFHTADGGPWLCDPDNLAWIESVIATDGETLSYWTAEDLL